MFNLVQLSCFAWKHWISGLFKEYLKIFTEKNLMRNEFIISDVFFIAYTCSFESTNLVLN